MQQYFSVAEVNFALQQVMWQRKQSLHPEQQSQLPQPQQFYTRAEAALDEGGTSKQMTNGVHDPRDLKGDFLIPKSVATAHQQSGLENPHLATQILASAGQSDIASDQKATGPENHANCQIAPAIVLDASLAPQPPPSAHSQPEPHQEKRHTEPGSRVSEATKGSPSPALPAQSSYHNLAVDADGNPSNAGNCTNGDSMEHTLDEAQRKSPTLLSIKTPNFSNLPWFIGLRQTV
jgi:hypothetical protein